MSKSEYPLISVMTIKPDNRDIIRHDTYFAFHFVKGIFNQMPAVTFVLVDVVHVVDVEVGVGVDGDTHVPDVGVDLPGLMSANVGL